jgi:hypothetical protein
MLVFKSHLQGSVKEVFFFEVDDPTREVIKAEREPPATALLVFRWPIWVWRC